MWPGSARRSWSSMAPTTRATPSPRSDRFVTELRKTGTEVVYLRFPDEGHSVTNLANRVHMWRQVAAFLEAKFGMAK
ncbi:prolyl oligopeptidase family serine peptidase [Phenylobacterium sp. J367]|uniref:prolyl oligopeptidase family serine peptidase n=1 Tax=Phenylobacterium sp. J367 TaxID=2898435 RepID=UPI0035B45DBB